MNDNYKGRMMVKIKLNWESSLLFKSRLAQQIPSPKLWSICEIYSASISLRAERDQILPSLGSQPWIMAIW